MTRSRRLQRTPFLPGVSPPIVDTQVLIAGAGLAGLATAYHLEQAGAADYLLIESEDRPGGWAKTEWSNGYGADRAIHVLYCRDPTIRAWVEALLPGRLREHTKCCLIDSGGIRTPFPFHANLHGRPPGVVRECLSGLWQASLTGEKGEVPAPVTFADWIDLSYGRGVARHFMDPYNTKMWTIPPSEMGCDWMGDFLPQIEPERILAGALGREESRLGLNATFSYPRRGISELAEAIASRIRPIRYRTPLVGLEASARIAHLGDGTCVCYRHLVSSLPLTMLARLARPLPAAVERAAGRLEALDLVLVDVGFRNPEIDDVHWVYLPDPDVAAYRLHVCHALSPDLAPPGHGLYCLEISHSRHRPLPPGELKQRIIADLIRTGWLRTPGQVTFYRERRLPCAYVLPRVGFRKQADTVRAHLRSIGIESIGRFGEWKYANMEDALADGRRAAAALKEGLGSPLAVPASVAAEPGR